MNHFFLDFHHQQMTQLYENITELHLSKGGVVTIQRDGTITGAESVKQKGSKLTIEGKGGSTMFMSGNNMVMSGNNMVIGNVGSGCTSYVSSNGSIFNFNGGNNVGGTTFINGVEVDMSRLNEIAVNNPKSSTPALKIPETPKTIHRLTNSTINNISIRGSSSLNPIPSEFLSKRLKINVKGSGDVMLNSEVLFEKLSINLNGSGDITGNNTVAEKCDINLVGSGDVTKIHMKTGSINLVGSGDVKVTADNPNSIDQNKIGSGYIRVR